METQTTRRVDAGIAPHPVSSGAVPLPSPTPFPDRDSARELCAVTSIANRMFRRAPFEQGTVGACESSNVAQSDVDRATRSNRVPVSRVWPGWRSVHAVSHGKRAPRQRALGCTAFSRTPSQRDESAQLRRRRARKNERPHGEWHRHLLRWRRAVTRGSGLSKCYELTTRSSVGNRIPLVLAPVLDTVDKLPIRAECATALSTIGRSCRLLDRQEMSECQPRGVFADCSTPLANQMTS